VVERAAVNRLVVGSSPTSGATPPTEPTSAFALVLLRRGLVDHFEQPRAKDQGKK
jgi:hypothetical protein